MCAYNRSTEDIQTGVPGAHWPASLPYGELQDIESTHNSRTQRTHTCSRTHMRRKYFKMVATECETQYEALSDCPDQLPMQLAFSVWSDWKVGLNTGVRCPL